MIDGLGVVDAIFTVLFCTLFVISLVSAIDERNSDRGRFLSSVISGAALGMAVLSAMWAVT